MTFFPNREPSQIPEPDESDDKEVFAFFGLCSYWIQILEQGLVNLYVSLKIRNLTHLTHEEIDALFDRARGKTLGRLISDVRVHIDVPTGLEAALANALKDRNFVTHHFFIIHDIDIISKRRRVKMIDELRQIVGRLQTVDNELELITHPLWERIGLTADMFQAELAEMEAEARKLDESS
ncbi:MAG: hypothetical protein HN929_06080 [Chloroflexi bacterium]|jgi:hypothetical protein|nr:hypothetical protein [Chloroflexota bacterium]MBT7081019.1 hypothetical protein [Chloroflexota bacterium]MBT7290002.1 hypothetical protein [Chloroflexota bacterium]